MADDETRVRKKQQKTSKKRPLKKFVTNVVSAITNAERFESLDYLARYSSLKILCSDFDSTYSSILSNYVISGSTEFRMIFKIVDKAEDVTLAVAKFTRNGFKLYPHSESFSSSSDDVDDSDLESESSAMIVKPKFVSVAQGGHVKVGEIYSNLHVPVYGVKCQEKNLYIIYHSSENEEKPIVTIRGKTDPSKWMAKSIGFSFSATSFKVKKFDCNCTVAIFVQGIIIIAGLS